MAVWKSRIPQLRRSSRSRLSKLVRAAAFEIEAQAKQLAPVRTGFLRSSIQAQMLDDLKAEVAVGADYGIYVEFGTRRMAPRPFLTPAAEQVITAIGGELKKVIPR